MVDPVIAVTDIDQRTRQADIGAVAAKWRFVRSTAIDEVRSESLLRPSFYKARSTERVAAGGGHTRTSRFGGLW